MAQKVLIQMVDDIDGTELEEGAGETVTFGLDGTTYEIDLSRKNADKLRGIIYDYTTHARKVAGGGRRRSGTTKTSTDGATAAQVRAWAHENNVKVPERGRIPAEVREAYEAAN